MAKDKKSDITTADESPVGASAVAMNAEAERVEAQIRLEAAKLKLAEVKAKLDSIKPAALARDDKSIEPPPGFFRNKRGLLVEEKHRGVKKYRTTELRYSNGHLYKPGDIVTLEDEMPPVFYVPVKEGAKKAAPVEADEEV